jgi:hypothetical protein
MGPAFLHRHLRQSLRYFSSPAEDKGLRALIESGGVEGFLRDLLFIELHAKKHRVSREHPLGNRSAVDIVLHDSGKLYIEAKQLHLKDGGRYAPKNITKDLKRHGQAPCLGIIYLVDERSSKSETFVERYGGANRRAKHEVGAVLIELQKFFTVFPASVGKALLRDFKGSGGVKLYGFVVTL